MEKIKITEEQHPEKEWFEDAKKQTIGTLETFIDHVINGYEHDYGTICHAVAACAIAAAWAANDQPSGGITGFQASFVMWDFIKQWSYPNAKTGMRLLNFDDMLYPQYSDKFSKTISRNVWESLQKEAQKRLSEDKEHAADSVVSHWQSIVNGKVPFAYTVKDN